MKKRLNKSGLSPVVATVLLIAMVIVIALIVFLWFRGMNQEVITKFSGTNIEIVCDDVVFNADYSPSNGQLYITNDGNIPIFRMDVKIQGQGSYSTKGLEEISTNWPETGLNPTGGVFSGDISGDIEDSTIKIILIPILRGSSDSGNKNFLCDEKRHGYELLV